MTTLDRETLPRVAPDAPRPSPTGSLGAWLPAVPKGRAGWLVTGAIVIAAGLALNWSWLVAVGAAPLLLMALPCAAMCALGLCMNRMGKRDQAADPSSTANSIAPNSTCCGAKNDSRQFPR